MFLKYNFQDFFAVIGDGFGWRLILLVAFARVFHHCHYFGDTLMGAATGLGVGYLFGAY
jgi:membrane-associated phospholipid phosphatase